MAMAIPAAIGLGTSLVGGIQGKGARKKQEQLARQQLAQLQPYLNASQSALGNALNMFPQASNAIQTVFNQATGAYEPLVNDYRSLLGGATPYLSGAANALGDLQRFYRPFMFEGSRAIDRFLPSAQRTNELLAPEFGNINQGYQSASENIARFAPRGGGRVSSLSRADLDRQKQISDTFFQGRQNLSNQALGAAFQGAQGQQGAAQALSSLGLGQGGLAQNAVSQALQALGLGGAAAGNLGQLSSSLFGHGMSGANILGNLYGQTSNRAYQQSPNMLDTGESLGSYLQKLFGNKGVQNAIGGIFGGKKRGGTLPGWWGGD